MRMLLNNWFQLKVAFFYKAKALHHTSLRLMASSTFPAWICYAIASFEKEREKKILLTEKAFVALFFSYSIFEKMGFDIWCIGSNFLTQKMETGAIAFVNIFFRNFK